MLGSSVALQTTASLKPPRRKIVDAAETSRNPGVYPASCCKIRNDAEVFPVQAGRPSAKAPMFFWAILELIEPRRHRISRLGFAPPGFCCSPAWCINRNEECFMRRLILAALLGVSLLPMAPPAEAQVVVMRRHPGFHRGRFHHRGVWYNHRAWRGGRWRYW
jgi:hypothetical protein